MGIETGAIVAGVGVAGAAAVKGVGFLLSWKAVPFLMAATGKIVPGVGTIHAAGGLTALTQSASALLIGSNPIALGVGAASAGAYVAYRVLA